MFVILKSLNNPDAITSEFVDKITMHHKFYGITLDLETKNYMVVLAYNLNDITPEFTINEIAINHKVYGITQDPEAKIYMNLRIR
ncbi:unnamed protein product [Rhizophagus irregularis]|nr:unnamed protein product [Rhizophagus irregularis]